MKAGDFSACPQPIHAAGCRPTDRRVASWTMSSSQRASIPWEPGHDAISIQSDSATIWRTRIYRRAKLSVRHFCAHKHTNLRRRIDHTLNKKTQIFGRYSYDWSNYQAPLWTANPMAGNGDFSTQYILHDQSLALGWTYTPSSSLVNTAHFGFLRDFSHSDPVGPDARSIRCTAIRPHGIPSTGNSGSSPQLYLRADDHWFIDYRPQFQVAQVWQFVDDVYKLVGNHSLQFGYEYHENSLNFFDLEAPQGAILATGIYTIPRGLRRRLSAGRRGLRLS